VKENNKGIYLKDTRLAPKVLNLLMSVFFGALGTALFSAIAYWTNNINIEAHDYISFSAVLSLFLLILNVFGVIVWKQPKWLIGSLNTIIMHAKQKKLAFFSGVLILLLIVVSYCVYISLPQPISYKASHFAPSVTTLSDVLTPEPLYIDFTPILDGVENTDSVSYSVAKLDLIGKKIPKGIQISPELVGQWSWNSESQLKFIPKQDWSAGQEYEVSFSESIFKADIKLSDNEHVFKTPDFELSLSTLAFYQDPNVKNSHKVVATLIATHPTDIDSVKSHLKLTQSFTKNNKSEVKPYKFDVTYDKHQREIYITSEPIQIQDTESYMYFTLDSGVKPVVGSSKADTGIKESVLIPSVNNFFRINTADVLMVKNAAGEPEQTFVLDFTDEIASQDVINKTTAYILPNTDSKGESKYWSSAREITNAVLKKLEKITLKTIPSAQDTAKLHSFTFDAPQNRQVYIRIEKGLKSTSDFIMVNAYDSILTIPEYPTEVNIMSDGAILSKNGDHKLSFLTRGVKALQVKVGKVQANQLNHLISQTSGDISNPEVNSYYFTAENISNVFTRQIYLKTEHPKKAVYSSIDLSNEYNESLELGLFFINAQALNLQDNYVYGPEEKRLILITDLGILVKNNADGSRDIFVQSIETGKPIAKAKVSLLGKNGLVILNTKTDSRGHAFFEDTTWFTEDQSPVAFVVETKNDTSFIPYNRNARTVNYSRFDIGGVSNGSNANNQIDAFVFSDRGIYRPGDNVNLAAIVKQQHFTRLGDIPLELEITDPKGSTVFKKRVSLDKYGLLDFNFKTQSSANTGTYYVSVQLIKDYGRDQLGSASFKVEEFVPDRLKINSEFSLPSAKGWISAARFKALVSLQNLFGTPAQNRRITAAVRLSPAGFYFNEYKDYVFSDPSSQGQNIRHSYDPLDETKTDVEGRAKFDIDLSRYEAGTYQLNFAVQGYEEGGGRSVRANSTVLVSPVEQLVGYKADGDLSYISKDSKRAVRFININSSEKQVARDELSLKLIEQQYVSTLVQQNNGTYKYQSVQKNKLISTDTFYISEEGADYALPTDNPGSYLVELVDSKDNTVSRVSFTVTGTGNIAGKLEKNAELQIQLNKKDYKPGEEIEISIVAPYTGSGLITIETNKVHAFKWFDSKTTSSIQTIKLPKNIEGNAYINVSFVRSLESREIFTSPLSYAVKPFFIDRSKREIKLDVNVPDKVKPGDDLVISYRSDTPSRLIIFAVDEGILQVAKYQTPKPLNHFLQKRALEVGTMQIVDLILPEFKLIQELAAAGGGSAEAMAMRRKSKQLNPFSRKVQKPVAFWSGILATDAKAKEHTFTIPDTFAGQLRVMAIAVNDVGVSVKENKTLVRGPFVLTPNSLTTAAPGDEFDITLGVANGVEGSGKQLPILVNALTSSNLEIVSDTQSTLNIDENSEGKLTFRVKVLDKLGAASVTFTAVSGKSESQRTATLSVRPAVAFVSSFDSGFTESGQKNIDISRQLYPNLAQSNITASQSPRALVDGLISYLDNFPHMCTEQVVSSVFPVLSNLEHPSYMGDVSYKHTRINDLIDTLRKRQLPDGSFMLWPGNTSTSVYSSLYVMHFLLDAKEAGLSVPNDMWVNGIEGVRNIASGSLTTNDRNRAYAIYLLTRQGEVTTNYLSDLEKSVNANTSKAWQQDISSAFMGATYQLMQASDKAQALINGYKIGQDTKQDNWGAYDSRLAHDGQYIYLLSKHFPERLKQLTKNDFFSVVEPIFEGRYNTLSSAWSVLAMDAYSKEVLAQAQPEDVKITATMKDGTVDELAITKSPYPKASFSTDTEKLDVSAAPRSFYMMSQSGFDANVPQEALSNGLEVTREYQDDEGNVVSSAQQGKELNVVIRVRSTTGKNISDVAVIDLLPGGFEVLRDSVRSNYNRWKSDYKDIREDRVVFYGSFGDSMTELTYKVKVTASGSFVVPAAYAESMYDLSVKAHSKAGRFDVIAAK
jgi:uncharacterized protein YfaS (alpha-2-macroglobulin family)